MNTSHENDSPEMDSWFPICRVDVHNSPSYVQEENQRSMGSRSSLPAYGSYAIHPFVPDQDTQEDDIDRLFVEVTKGNDNAVTLHKVALCFVQSSQDIGGRTTNVSSPWTWRDHTVEATSLLLPLSCSMRASLFETQRIMFPPPGSNYWKRMFMTADPRGESFEILSIALRWKPSSGTFSLFDGKRISLQLLGTNKVGGAFQSVVLSVTIVAPHLQNFYDERDALLFYMARGLQNGMVQTFLRFLDRDIARFASVITYSTREMDVQVGNNLEDVDLDEANITGRVRNDPSSTRKENQVYMEYGTAEATEEVIEDFDAADRPTQYRIRPARVRELSRFPVFAAGTDLEDELCSICQCNFEAGQDVRKLVCIGRHMFHRGCIDEWLLTSFSCPIDRTDFTKAIDEETC